MKVSITYNEENEYNDNLFKNNSLDRNLRIDTNPVYNTPSVKTWYLTNVHRSNYWIDADGLPMQPVYTPNMLHSHNTQQGVYIIKRFSIPPELISSISDIARILHTNNLNISEKDKTKMLLYLTNMIQHSNFTRNVNLRIVYFISKEDLDNNKVISTTNIKVSKSIDDLYNKELSDINIVDEVMVNNNKELVYTLDLTYHSTNSEEFKISVLDTEVVLKPNKIYSGEDHIRASLHSPAIGAICITKHYKQDINLYGILGKSDRPLEILKEFSEHQLQISNNLANKVKAINDWRKYLIDQEISLHKLNAYAINNLTAELKLEKEEVTAFKDGLKFIKDIVL